MKNMNKQSVICHLTSAHSDGDIRIFHKLAVSSAERYKTYFIVPNGKTRIENNVDAAYKTSVCLGCCLDDRMTMPCQRNISIDV